MQTIRKTPVKSNFTVTPNRIINDVTLSALARLALAYLLGKPDNWKVRANDLKRFLCVGINKTYRILKELRDAGYVVMERVQSAVHWFVYDIPQRNDSAATGRVIPDRDGFHHDEISDELTNTDYVEKIKKTTTELETISEQKANNVVDINLDCFSAEHRPAARKALSSLTEDQAAAVMAVFTAAMSGRHVSNPVGYLIQLTRSAKGGTLSVAQGRQQLKPLAERIANERRKAKETSERGKLSNAQWFEMMKKQFGDRFQMP